jgi:hypothetical protein
LVAAGCFSLERRPFSMIGYVRLGTGAMIRFGR